MYLWCMMYICSYIVLFCRYVVLLFFQNSFLTVVVDRHIHHNTWEVSVRHARSYITLLFAPNRPRRHVCGMCSCFLFGISKQQPHGKNNIMNTPIRTNNETDRGFGMLCYCQANFCRMASVRFCLHSLAPRDAWNFTFYVRIKRLYKICIHTWYVDYT